MITRITKPNKKELLVSLVGPKKFCCRYKCEFGLSTQGVYDAKCRFSDVSVGYPGSMSDYAALVTSGLYSNVKKKCWLLV